MKCELIKQITPELSLHLCNEIPVLRLRHAVGTAKIALQGAHIFSWKPANAAQDMFWLSELEPLKAGTALRGGIPICFPWFNDAGLPTHGYARTSLWQLSGYEIHSRQVRLEFCLFSDDNLIIAKTEMTFSHEFNIRFTNYAEDNAQVALHSYFNIGDIQRISVHNLPTTAFSFLTQTQESVPSPRTIGENVDCLYSARQGPTLIKDEAWQRNIEIEHHNASDVVLWNPWHKPTSNMTETGYQSMLCVETARINQRLARGESIAATIRLK
ncbi:D-hexose-6-phosphate mutarotase [Pasteurellaceae bacterium LIM206]|nr:D-hexose-6-phosphate mutarotase [Pasteurellaceae bacterium LIM206]